MPIRDAFASLAFCDLSSAHLLAIRSAITVSLSQRSDSALGKPFPLFALLANRTFGC